jgi:uncharacterized protein YeaO (DUF488 family)
MRVGRARKFGADFGPREVRQEERMPISIVKLGSPRVPNEGLRLGTVRRPPRGVPKAEFASRNFYDIWLPLLSPSAKLLAEGRSALTERRWLAFQRKFLVEMKRPEPAKLLDLLAALSHQTNLSIGCYCDNEEGCHRGILRHLLEERSASIKRDGE